MTIKIDTTKDSLMSEQARELVTKYYTTKEETSAQEAYARAAQAFSGGDKKLAQRIYNYVSDGWFMFSSPVLSNAPSADGKSNKGLPISCFLTKVPDSLKGLIDHSSEVRWLSVKGGGVGGHWSSVRAVSDKAPGVIPFLHTVDADMTAYRQGTTRKGSYAAYLGIDHPDIIEFINTRVPTGGDINRKCFNIHNAVNLTDDFMVCVRNGKKWALRDPDTGTVRETVDARELWQRLLETRYRTGEPYLNFIDTANNALPQSMKDKGLKINGSNLCLTGDVLVDVLIDGVQSKMRLDSIVMSNQDIKVLSMNTATGRTTYEEVTAKALMQKDAELYEVIDEKGNAVRCTGDHKFWTENRGYVMAKDLKETDVLKTLSYNVYKILNKVTGKSYVGYTRHSPEHRLKVHINNCLNGKDTYLYRSMRKHGIDNFSTCLMASFDTKEKALKYEAQLIEVFGDYNETAGGAGGWCVPDDKFFDWCKNISKKNTGEGNPKWSGFSDVDILDAAFAFFNGEPIEAYAKRKPSVTEFLRWSNSELGMPLSYSKVRFGEYEGSGRERFRQAYKEWSGLND